MPRHASRHEAPREAVKHQSSGTDGGPGNHEFQSCDSNAEIALGEPVQTVLSSKSIGTGSRDLSERGLFRRSVFPEPLEIFRAQF